MLSITYLSSATTPWTHEQLAEMIASFKPRNESVGLSGVLLYAGGSFIQTLEGPDDVVDATYARIKKDPRHRDVIIALREPITERAFPDWSMGFKVLAADHGDLPEGYNDYLDEQRSLVESGRFRAEVFHRIFRDTSRH